MRIIYSLLLYLFFITPISCSAQKNTENKVYSFKYGDPNGIGKWYMGREIAHVMGYQGIDWLERTSREIEENTSQLIRNMDLQRTDVIVDVGAGSGYHVFKMAPKVKEGKVYAVDIQQEMLDAIKEKKRKKHTNIETVKGTEKSIQMPNEIVDKVLMVDVYHEFAFPQEMLASIHASLKEDGKIYLIEYRGEDPGIPIKKVHKMTEAQAVKEFEAAGFKLQENMDNLPWQHCMIFIKSR